MPRFAILIGINAYLEVPLKGCVRDVEAIENILKGTRGAPVEIHRFTADLDNFPRSTSVTDEPSVCPTYDNICSCFNDVTNEAQAGDFVYIHYSGHGTTTERVDEVSNKITRDLALVLLLAPDNPQIRYLGGLQLAHLIKRMVQKGVVVSLVLDCCFSGGVVRKDHSVRFLDYDPSMDALFAREGDQYTNLEDTDHESIYRTASLRPNWLINPDGYTILTACGPSEVARELTINKNGDRHGFLSYFLLRTFLKLGGVEGEHRQIYHHIRARFQESCAKGLIKQTPMIYGNARLCFFGPSKCQRQVNSIPILVRPDGTIQLEAGKAHAICTLDVFALAPLDTIPDHNSTLARVTKVDALTSELILVDLKAQQPETGWMAEPLSVSDLSKHPLRLQLNNLHTKQWEATLKGRWGFDIVDDADTLRHASLHITANNDDMYEIQDEKSNWIIATPITASSSDQDTQHLVSILTHLCRFFKVRDLFNSSTTDASDAFNQSFDVRIINAHGKNFKPGCIHQEWICTQCNHTECMIEVEEGENLQLQINNHNASDGRPLYLHLYCMGHDWEIENMLCANHEIILPRNTAVDAKGMWKKTMKMVLSDETKQKGLSHFDDIIKVFVTERQTSFSSLELPELLTPLEIKTTVPNRGVPWNNGSENWAALNFRIRTHLK